MSKAMHYFRKNQAIIMAGLVIVAIITFTVGPIFLDAVTTGWGGRREDNVVVTWSKGRITESEMVDKQRAHAQAMRVVQALAQETYQKKGQPRGMNSLFAPTDEMTVVQVMLLADRAKALGMTVSDEAVKDFIYRLTDGKLKDGDIARVLQSAYRDQFNDEQFFRQMKTELLASQMFSLTYVTFNATQSPAEAFSYYERMTRRAEVEALPVKVEDFVAQVTATAKEEDLEALYEKYKDRIASPRFPEPGFLLPRQAAVQYVSANFKKFLDEEKAKLTEEQIKAEYELAIKSGDFKVTELPADPTKTGAGKEPDVPVNPKTDPNPILPATDPNPVIPADPAAPAPPATDTKPPAENPPAAPAPPAPDTKPPAETPPAAPCVQAAQEQPATEAQPANPPGDEPKTEKKETDPPAQPAAPPAQTTDPATPPTPEKTPAAETPAAEKPAAEGDNKQPEVKPTDPATPPPAPKFKPLSEVRDEVMRRMASQPATKRVQAAFDAIRVEVEKHGVKAREARSETAKASDDSQKLAPLDIAALAKKYNLEYETLPLMGPFEVEKTAIGKSGTYDFSGGQARNIPFISSAFDPSRQFYRPDVSYTTDDEFLYWITDDKAQRLPTFEECRGEVEAAWKFGEARKLAKAAAEKLAKDATIDKTLKETFPNRQITVTPPFSWLSTGNTPNGPVQLDRVQGIDLAGLEFMKTVFRLNVGETGVAVDQPERIYYVTRVLSKTPDEKVLRENFVNLGGFQYNRATQSVGRQERSELTGQWVNDLEKQYNVKWEREALVNNDNDL